MSRHSQGLREVGENWINETAALTQWRSQIITSSHLANQCYSAHIYVNHAQKLIGMTGSLPIYYYYTYCVKPGAGRRSHGSEFSWLNHWVHTAVVTRKQQLISQPPVHSGSILTRLLITLHGKNILIRQVKRDLEAMWFSPSVCVQPAAFLKNFICRKINIFRLDLCCRGDCGEFSFYCLCCLSWQLPLFISFVSSLPPPPWKPSPLTHAHAQSLTKNAH